MPFDITRAEWPKKSTTWIENRILYVSIPFTWELPKIKTLLRQRSFFFDRAIVGGPAVALMPDYLSGLTDVEICHNSMGVLQRVNNLATKTSTGCIRKCQFCAVPKIEGSIRELKEWPDLPIICDNNLLACTTKHFNKVIERLKKHEFVDFNQGIDPRLLKKNHAIKFTELKNPIIRLSLDSMEYADQWELAFLLLRNAGLPKKAIRSYVLIGFDDSPKDAWQRCEWIAAHKIKVLPMWFHTLTQLKKNIVTQNQINLGWTDFERKLIMGYYYQRGKRGALILKDYGSRLNAL